MLSKDSKLIQETVKYDAVCYSLFVQNLSQRQFDLLKAFYYIPDIKYVKKLA